jgi:hypothetical protein
MKMEQIAALMMVGHLTANCGTNKAPERPGEEVQLDVSALASVDHSLRLSGNAGITWNARVLVGSSERAKVESASIESVQEMLSGIKLKSYDNGRIELTATNDSRILATNVQQVAYQHTSNREFWDRECKNVTPEFNLANTALQQRSGKKYVQITVNICDFEGISVVPTVAIQSQKQDNTQKQVAYRCALNFSYVGSSYLSLSSAVLCEYGYDSVDGDSAPVIEVPKAFEPQSEYYEAHRLKMERINIAKDSNGRRYHLDTRFDDLPFGSHASCTEQKVDLFYMDGNTVKKVRVKYKRHHSTSGEVIWVLANESEVPAFDAVLEYYKNASANSRAAVIYRICDWSPATMNGDPSATSRL